MKHCIEFIEDTHTYVVDGIIVPSITQIMKVKYGDMYNHVPQNVLNRASERGTMIHKAIELYEKENKDSDHIELYNYKFLKQRYGWETLGSEVMVALENNGEVIAAGTLDLLVEIDGKKGIGDIKTTSTLNREYLSYQLNLYRIAYQQCTGENIDFLFGLHLRGDVRKKRDIPINSEAAMEIYEEYKKGNEDEINN